MSTQKLNRNGYLESERPESELLIDLAVYIVPPELWRENLHSAVSDIDVVSAGFLRVHPEAYVSSLRDEIEHQLSEEFEIPQSYVFLKNVGKCLTKVRHKQEITLKVKSFIPPGPSSFVPEIYLLEGGSDSLSYHQTSSSVSSSYRSEAPPVTSSHRNLKEDPYQINSYRGKRFVFQKPIPPIQTGDDARYETTQQNHYPNDRYMASSPRPDSALLRQQEEEARRRAEAERQERLRREIEEQRRREEEERRRREEQDRLRREDEERRRRLAAEEEERRRREEEERRRRELEEEDERRRRELEEDEERRRREEEERRRREEEERRRRGREDDERRRWELEEEERRRREEEAERLRLEEEERKREEEERARREAELQSRDNEDEYQELQDELNRLREERRETERQREELVKKAKQLQSKTQSKRNQARDVWKKKYFEEKKKSPPLEDSCTKQRQELESLHKRIVNTMEGGGTTNRGGRLGPLDKPSPQNNIKIQVARLQHEIQDLHRRVETIKMKLTAEMKLRNQAEVELRALRAELTQRKINVTLARSRQQQNHQENESMTPRSQQLPPLTSRS